MATLVHRHQPFSLAIAFCLLTCSGAYLARARMLDDARLSIGHGFKVLSMNVADASNNKNDFECPADGFYPVGECDPFYYTCLDGVVYPAVCPGNGIFDPAVSACVEYGSSSCATTTAFTGSTPPAPIKCGDDGFYAFGDCLESYYLCVDGVAYFERCPPGLVFVESLQNCKTPAEAGCPEITSTTPSTTTASTTTTTQTPSTPSTTGSTSSSTVTSTTTESTTTTTASTTTSPSTTRTTTPPPTTCSEPDGFYGYAPCQHVYYACRNGIQLNETCPNDWVFDERKSTCVPQAECNDCEIVTVVLTRAFQCPNSATGFYPLSPGGCYPNYYTCYQCEPYPQKCPDGTVFDETTHSCELPQNVGACNPLVLNLLFNETPL